MRKKNKKQKRGILFSTTLVITGCLLSALYIGNTMQTAENYKVDLSQLDAVQQAADAQEHTADSVAGNSMLTAPELNTGAGVAQANGSNVINDLAQGAETGVSEGTAAGQQTALEESKKQSVFEETADASVIETGEEVADATEGIAQTLSFAPEDGMSWPLPGDVILNYSMDKAVFFSTLEQYKYNPAILISAEAGDKVSACAKGQIEEIGNDAEIGQYVVMNLGSGYQITYGQLENLQVEEGQLVSRGQVLGSTAEVTKYYTVEGNHVYLKIEKDTTPVNPLDLLE